MEINDLKKGDFFIFRDKIFKVLDMSHSHIGRGGANVQLKMKDIKTGNILNQSFKPTDQIQEADLEKKKIKFIFSHRGSYTFSLADNPSKRFQIPESEIEQEKGFLKENTEIDSLWSGDEFIGLSLPPKIDLKVIEAPPNFKGNTAQGGTKEVIVETGLKVKAPMFIKAGDVIRVNTDTGEYTERVSN